MFGSALIIFRESLEAALLIGIIAAATRGIDGRSRWISAGVGLGIVGSLIIALLTESIAEFAGGIGQELFKAALLGIAVVMIGWHNIWMASHGKELVQKAKHVGHEVRDGSQHLSAIAIAIAVTVLREGSESVLFLQGMMASSATGIGPIMLGGLFGLLAGAGVGAIAYFGLVRIPMRKFFSITSNLLLLLAAGLAGQMAKFLIQADVIPALAAPLWDTSSILPTDSALGSALYILLGYDAQPSAMQFIFYVLTFVCIASGASFVNRQTRTASYQLKSA